MLAQMLTVRNKTRHSAGFVKLTLRDFLVSRRAGGGTCIGFWGRLVSVKFIRFRVLGLG